MELTLWPEGGARGKVGVSDVNTDWSICSTNSTVICNAHLMYRTDTMLMKEPKRVCLVWKCWILLNNWKCHPRITENLYISNIQWLYFILQQFCFHILPSPTCCGASGLCHSFIHSVPCQVLTNVHKVAVHSKASYTAKGQDFIIQSLKIHRVLSCCVFCCPTSGHKMANINFCIMLSNGDIICVLCIFNQKCCFPLYIFLHSLCTNYTWYTQLIMLRLLKKINLTIPIPVHT